MSEVLEINGPAKLRLKIDGKEFELMKPTRKQLAKVNEALRTDEGKEKALDIIGDFLVEAGLPKEVADELQIEHMQKIFEALVGAKKN